jgi:hypothetical protein
MEVEGLGALPALATVEVSGNHIASVEGLRGAPVVEQVILSGNPVADMSPLQSLPKLESLWIAGTGVRDLAAVAGMAQLTDLAVDCQGQDATTPHDSWDFSPLLGRDIGVQRWNSLPFSMF